MLDEAEMKEGGKMPMGKRRRVVAGTERKMGFAPYEKSIYEEVFLNKPEYSKFLIEEGRRDNAKGRFTHWMMAIMVDAVFEIGRDIPEGSGDSWSENERKERNRDRRE